MIVLEVIIFSGILSMCFSILGISIENNISMILLSGLLLGLYNRHYYIKKKNKYK